MPRLAISKPFLRGGIRSLFRFMRNAFAIIGLVLVINYLFFGLSMVVSSSMKPTLQGEGGPGSDWLLCEKFTYWYRSPQRWEVVTFRNVDGLFVAKRVVGLPGEEISLDDLKPVIDGTKLFPPKPLSFLRYYEWGNLNNGKIAASGTGYYVLGDDSRDSADSRFDGPVQPEDIQSRAWLRVWPWHRIGFVNP